MKKKLVSILLCTTMVASMLVGCGSSTATEETAPAEATTEAATEEAATEAVTEAATTEAAAATEVTYKGDLNIMHFSTSEESEGNGGSDGFRTMIAEWKEAHPDVNLTENVLANAEYKTQIATLAAADDLPDVFLVQGMNVKDWASQGLVMDMTDVIKNSPDSADYKENFFTPFKDDAGKIYGIPAL
ncbi:MAG: extracellular solute-binding protein, partial [Lachnospiraceae bacterium]|nr:extracellular solute-binding protein [Lachnospiraceae bacterium]